MDDIQISFERGKESSREASIMQAELYNNFHILLSRSERGHVFVPIRGMQYLAVIDAEEVIFSDSNARRMIQVAWQHFKPQRRDSLAQPVAYDCVIYDGADIDLTRLQNEFFQAVDLLLKRQRPNPTDNTVINFMQDDK